MKPANPSSDQRPVRRDAAGEPELPALGWLHRARAEDELLSEVARRVRVRRARRVGLIGGVAAVTIGVGVWWTSVSPRSVETIQPIAFGAKVAMPERRILPDGSAVELKEGAQIEVNYSGAFRRVVLRKGEAHFEVVKNAQPFIVEAAGVSVRAVGTAFSVQLGSEQVEVLVTEGRVRVAPAAGTASVSKAGESLSLAAPAEDLTEFTVTQPLVDAGYRAIISFSDDHPQVGAVTEAEASELLSWRIANLEFSRTPLPEVVALMNRHAPARQKTRFAIVGPGLDDVRLSGFLRTDNSEGLVRLLENQFAILAERSGDTITLRKAP
jgi:transmembrane sensor